MKSKRLVFIISLILIAVIVFGCTGCNGTIKGIYKSREEWASRFKLPEYHENKEIVGSYDKNLSAKCTNGTFVGTLNKELNVKNWRGIPFAKIPARFERSVEPDPSDKVYEAYYFGKSCMQSKDESEMASMYEQSDIDCLTLTVTTGNNNIKNKPVLVYIHGGGWVNGGTVDQTYESSLFGYYNPDVVIVNIQYRLNFIGMINLGVKDEDGNYLLSDYSDKFKTSTNNGILDQIQALRWIKKNISAFGGNPDNVTISGESAGCGAVYNLLTMVSDPNNHYLEKSENLFQKVIAMSGGINQGVTLKNSEVLTRLFLHDHPNIKTIKEIQDLPLKDLFDWRTKNSLLTNNYILDGEVLSKDMYKTFCENVDPDITVLTGATTNEFAYYKLVFKPVTEANPKYNFNNICKSICELVSGMGEGEYDFDPSKEFLEAEENYLTALEEEGFLSAEEKVKQFANDFSLQGFNYYLALKQIARGCNVYTYSFNIPYNGKIASLKSAHAVDCFYTFGNFDGEYAYGTVEQVEMSRRWQKILVNFCKTGNPSIEGLDWKKYSDNNTTCIIDMIRFEVQQNWKVDRYKYFEQMVDNNEKMKYVTPWGAVFEHIDTFPS